MYLVATGSPEYVANTTSASSFVSARKMSRSVSKRSGGMRHIRGGDEAEVMSRG